MPETKCPVCNGKGKWRLKTTNAVVRCPNCQGEGVIPFTDMQEQAKENFERWMNRDQRF